MVVFPSFRSINMALFAVVVNSMEVFYVLSID